MNSNRITIKAGLWHPKSVKPVYRHGGDNRIFICSHLLDGVKCVSYETLRPDGTIINTSYIHHNEKWIRKHGVALAWEHVIIDYWAWVTDIIPI